MKGAELLTLILKEYGITHVHGVVGIPITVLAETLVEQKVPFIGYRNEQAASYAASVEAFLQAGRRPGVLLSCGGPGFINSLAGIFNALENRWPMLVLVGSTRDSPLGHNFGKSDQSNLGKSFQELDHHLLLTGRNVIYKKLYSETSNASQVIWELLHLATPTTMSYGKVAVLELSGAWLEGSVTLPSPNSNFVVLESEPESESETVSLQNEKLLNLCHGRSKPLILFGKEAAFYNCSKEIATLTEKLKIPFIMMPMARGILSDYHPMHMAAARSRALHDCDLLILIGAPLDWMLPLSDLLRPDRDIEIILLDIDPPPNIEKCQSFQMSFSTAFRIIITLSENIARNIDPWTESLCSECRINRANLEPLLHRKVSPLNYHCVYQLVLNYIDPNTVLVCEGSNTLNIARVILPSYRPRHRLDTGTFATEGIGLPYVIAAALHYPNTPILYVAGDSGFGFSMAELETILRYGLTNITILIMNNSGIYLGIDEKQWEEKKYQKDNKNVPYLLPPTALMPGIRYDEYTKMFPDRLLQGFHVTNFQELRHSFDSRNPQGITLINVVIDPRAGTCPKH